MFAKQIYLLFFLYIKITFGDGLLGKELVPLANIAMSAVTYFKDIAVCKRRSTNHEFPIYSR